MEEFAARERRTLGNLGEILVSWAVEQLREAGSTEKLFSRKIPVPRKPDGNYRRLSAEEQRTEIIKTAVGNQASTKFPSM
jgi:hypothetical protein